ncbi:MAG: hypothetical protein TREMPRED_003418 [Tremellales sp. Tagirdzhanova-0007]|nr:MAG: hypothetical protein TREMPRED_003418 [Tremellales sp. Tagirdzhanova-0007]
MGHVPHTALLIVPQGQLISSASTYGYNSSDQLISEVDEEARWLAGPERVRLLLGLASQWEEDESAHIECELGRLFLCPIPLLQLETPPSIAAVPSVRPHDIQAFVLVLNGTSKTPWTDFTAKADSFKQQWCQ